MENRGWVKLSLALYSIVSDKTEQIQAVRLLLCRREPLGKPERAMGVNLKSSAPLEIKPYIGQTLNT